MSAGIGCTNKIHSSSTVRRSVDREMYRIPRDEPKSYWEKLRLKQCAGFTMVGRHVWIACIVCIFIIAANSLWRPSTLIPGDTWIMQQAQEFVLCLKHFAVMQQFARQVG